MFSKCVLEMIGLKINVYGLEEYKALPENTPLSAMFFCHGYGHNQEMLEKYCQKMCQLNETRGSNDHYLLIITLDHPNAGTRLAYDDGYIPKKGTYKNQDAAFRMFIGAKSTAYTISVIIECFDIYAFGTESKSFVEKWGCVGYSMGGMSTLLISTMEPKISTVVLISTCIRIDLWFPYFVRSLGLETEFYTHERMLNVAITNSKDLAKNLRDKNLLILCGGKDKSLPKHLVDDTLDELRKTQQGIEGYDWKCDILPDGKHDIDDAYVIEATKWIKKWMLPKPVTTELMLKANL